MNQVSPPLSVAGLRTAFGENVIHDGLDLEMRQGEILGLVGGSGSGKSVLLETILGLRRPDGGTVRLLGCDIHDPGEREAVEHRIGVMFQNGALFSSLTVQENVEAPLREHTTLDHALVRRLAALKVRLSGLPDDARDKRPSELSGGMRKRAAVARALALDPELLFLDEPTSGLDPISADEFDKLVCGLRDALGISVLVITHDLATLYASCDRVAVLTDKRIVAVSAPGELARSDHPWVRKCFGGTRGRAAQECE